MQSYTMKKLYLFVKYAVTFKIMFIQKNYLILHHTCGVQ